MKFTQILDRIRFGRPHAKALADVISYTKALEVGSVDAHAPQASIARLYAKQGNGRTRKVLEAYEKQLNPHNVEVSVQEGV